MADENTTPVWSSAFLQMSVNDVDKGAARVLVHDTDILISVASLQTAGLVTIPGKHEVHDGEDYVRADSLGPQIQVKYDPDNLALNLTVEAGLLAATTVDLGNAPPKLEYAHNDSGFINYALTTQNADSVSFLSEQGLSVHGMFFDNNMAIDANGRFVRGSTNLTIDDRTKLARVTVGDSIADGGLLGGAAQVAGISYATDFAINPYFSSYPGQRFAGTANLPSTADVYVNGVLVRTLQLPPGPFNLENLPVVAGAGGTRIVLRNPFGVSQELGGPYYLDTHALRKGLSDFDYTIGVERNPTGIGIGSYNTLRGLARHRYGLTDTLTVGGFVTGEPHRFSGGSEVTLTLPVGTLAFYGAGSTDHGSAGASASAQYGYQSRYFSIGGAVTYTSVRYSTLGLDRNDDRAIYRYSAFIGTRWKEVDLTADLARAEFRDAGVSQRVSVTASTHFGSRYNLGVTVSREEFASLKVNNGIFVSMSVALGHETTATASVNDDLYGPNGTVQLQKSRPIGEGWGYLVQGAAGARAQNVADVQYQGKYGLYEVDATHQDGRTMVTTSIAGAVAFLGGHVYATRPIQDAYGLIRVPDVAGVTGYVSHQEVGKTDSKGNLLVPNLLSYYGNQLGINDQDIPLTYAVAETERDIAPPYRGAAVVEFPVKRLQAFRGALAVEKGGESVIPAFGEIRVDLAGGEVVTSPLNARGEFYLESLPRGTIPATIDYAGGLCRFDIKVPISTERFVQLGKLTCAQTQ